MCVCVRVCVRVLDTCGLACAPIGKAVTCVQQAYTLIQTRVCAVYVGLDTSVHAQRAYGCVHMCTCNVRVLGCEHASAACLHVSARRRVS